MNHSTPQPHRSALTPEALERLRCELLEQTQQFEDVTRILHDHPDAAFNIESELLEALDGETVVNDDRAPKTLPGGFRC